MTDAIVIAVIFGVLGAVLVYDVIVRNRDERRQTAVERRRLLREIRRQP